jgi:hypothetical protein
LAARYGQNGVPIAPDLARLVQASDIPWESFSMTPNDIID